MGHVARVDARFDGKDFLVDVVPTEGTPEGTTYAAYLFRNEKKVLTRWYAPGAQIRFAPRHEARWRRILARLFPYSTRLAARHPPGIYRVQAFAEVPGGARSSGMSHPMFVNPRVVTPATFAEATADGNYAYQLQGARWKFPALLYPGRGEHLFVMMPSAIDRSRHVLPVFSRGGWASRGVFPGEVLCVADPTLDLDPRLCIGWCIGTEAHDAVPELAAFVTALAAARGIPNDRIVIYGSSAGGFAALALAAQIEGATAIAVNAQTDALRYEITRHVDTFREAAFGSASVAAIHAAHQDRVDMVRRWQRVRHSRVLMVQNELDRNHHDEHFLPFWASIGGQAAPVGLTQAGRHAAWVYRDPQGHAPETAQMGRQIAAMLTSPEGFSRLPPAV